MGLDMIREGHLRSLGEQLRMESSRTNHRIRRIDKDYTILPAPPTCAHEQPKK
jgi:hypothetical protein